MTRLFAAAGLVIAVAACAHESTPPSPAKQRDIEMQAANTLNEMRERQPGIDSLLASSAGYAVFPSVGSAGAFIAGGAYGKGVLYEHGRPSGFVTLKQGSVGFTLGGQTFGELLILRSGYDVNKLKAGQFTVSGDIGMVVLKTGAAAEGTLDPNTSVVVMPHGGLMASLTVSGQTIDFIPQG